MKFQFVVNKKKRSLISCTECRRKKQKCDELKPTCTRCSTKNRTCNYVKASEMSNVKKCPTMNGIRVFKAMYNSIHEKEDNIKEKNISNTLIKCPIRESHLNNKYLMEKEIKGSTENDEKGGNKDNFDTFLLDLDLEYQALTILSTSEHVKDKFNRYNKCYSLILPMAYSNKSVMFTFAGWILSMNQNDQSEKFLNESAKIFNAMERKVLSDKNNYSNEIGGIIVSETCQAILASSKGDYMTWKKMFDKTYNLLKHTGIENSISLLQDNAAACWVLAWFFYQDIFKLGKSSAIEFFGPLFPKNIYKKIFDISTRHKISDSFSCCGPLTKCCLDLYIITGEVKTLYDLYIVKFEELENYNNEYIAPILENPNFSSDEIYLFIESENYKKYQKMKDHFYSWFGMKAGILELKTSEAKPNLDIEGYTNEQIEKLEKFHELLKLSIRIFLKVKILKCSITSYEIKILCKQALARIQSLISWEINNCLLFPFLIASSCIYEKTDQIMVQLLYEDLKKYITSGNLNKAWDTIQIIWNSYSSNKGKGNLEDILSIIDFGVCVF